MAKKLKIPKAQFGLGKIKLKTPKITIPRSYDNLNSLYRVVDVPFGSTTSQIVNASKFGTTIPLLPTVGRRTGYTHIQQNTPFDVLNTTNNQNWVLGAGPKDKNSLINLYGGNNPFVVKMSRENPYVGPETPTSINNRTDVLNNFQWPYTQNVGKWNPVTGQFDLPLELGSGVYTTLGKSMDDLAKIPPGSIVNPNYLSRGDNNITTIFGPKGTQVRDVQGILSAEDYLKFWRDNPNFKFNKGGELPKAQKGLFKFNKPNFLKPNWLPPSPLPTPSVTTIPFQKRLAFNQMGQIIPQQHVVNINRGPDGLSNAINDIVSGEPMWFAPVGDTRYLDQSLSFLKNPEGTRIGNTYFHPIDHSMQNFVPGSGWPIVEYMRNKIGNTGKLGINEYPLTEAEKLRKINKGYDYKYVVDENGNGQYVVDYDNPIMRSESITKPGFQSKIEGVFSPDIKFKVFDDIDLSRQGHVMHHGWSPSEFQSILDEGYDAIQLVKDGVQIENILLNPDKFKMTTINEMPVTYDNPPFATGGQLPKAQFGKGIKFTPKVRKKVALDGKYLPIKKFDNVLSRNFTKGEQYYLQNTLIQNPSLITEGKIDLDKLEWVANENLMNFKFTDHSDLTAGPGGYGGVNSKWRSINDGEEFGMYNYHNLLPSKITLNDNQYSLGAGSLNIDPSIIPQISAISAPGLVGSRGFLDPHHDGIGRFQDGTLGWYRGFVDQNYPGQFNLTELQTDLNKDPLSNILSNSKSSQLKNQEKVGGITEWAAKLGPGLPSYNHYLESLKTKSFKRKLKFEKNTADLTKTLNDKHHELEMLQAEYATGDSKYGLDSKIGNKISELQQEIKMLQDHINTQYGNTQYGDPLNQSILWPRILEIPDLLQSSRLYTDPTFQMNNQFLSHIQDRGFNQLVLPNKNSLGIIEKWPKDFELRIDDYQPIINKYNTILPNNPQLQNTGLNYNLDNYGGNIFDLQRKSFPAFKQRGGALAGAFKPNYIRRPVPTKLSNMLGSPKYQDAIKNLYTLSHDPNLSFSSLTKNILNPNDKFISTAVVGSNSVPITNELSELIHEFQLYGNTSGAPYNVEGGDNIKGLLTEAMSQQTGDPGIFYKSNLLRNQGPGTTNLGDEFIALQNMHSVQPHRVVQPLDLSLDNTGKIIGYNMENFPGVSLKDYTAYGLDIPKYTMKNIDRSIKRLHREGLVHGDLHGGNILIDPTTGRDFRFIDPVGYPNIFDIPSDLNRFMTNDWKNNTRMRKYYENEKPFDFQDYLIDQDYKDLNKSLFIPNNFTKPYSFPKNQLNLRGRKMNFGPGVRKYGGQRTNYSLDTKPDKMYKTGGCVYKLRKAQDGTETNSYDNQYSIFENWLQEQETSWDYVKNTDSAVLKPDGKTYYKMYEDGLFYPYYLKNSDGTYESKATIGFGKRGADVYETYKDGMSLEDAETFRTEDIDNSLRKTKVFIDANYGENAYDNLPDNTKFMLTDFTYNLGKLSKYPKFADAIMKGDTEAALEHYIRNDEPGGSPLARNEAYLEKYLQPWVDRTIEMRNKKMQQHNKMQQQFVAPADNTAVGNNPFGGWRAGGETHLKYMQNGGENGGKQGGNINDVFDFNTNEFKNGWTKETIGDWVSRKGNSFNNIISWYQNTQNYPMSGDLDISDRSTWEGKGFGTPNMEMHTRRWNMANLPDFLQNQWNEYEDDGITFKPKGSFTTERNAYYNQPVPEGTFDGWNPTDFGTAFGLADDAGVPGFFYDNKPYTTEELDDNIFDWRSNDQINDIQNLINEGIDMDMLINNPDLTDASGDDYYNYMIELYKDDKDKSRLLRDIKKNYPEKYTSMFSPSANAKLYNQLRSHQGKDKVDKVETEENDDLWDGNYDGTLTNTYDMFLEDGSYNPNYDLSSPGFGQMSGDNGYGPGGYNMPTIIEDNKPVTQSHMVDQYLMSDEFNKGVTSAKDFAANYNEKELADFKSNYIEQYFRKEDGSIDEEQMNLFLQYNPTSGQMTDGDNLNLNHNPLFENITMALNNQINVNNVGNNTMDFNTPGGSWGVGGNNAASIYDYGDGDMPMFLRDRRMGLLNNKGARWNSATENWAGQIVGDMNEHSNKPTTWWERNVSAPWNGVGQWANAPTGAPPLSGFIFNTLDWAGGMAVPLAVSTLPGNEWKDDAFGEKKYYNTGQRFIENPTLAGGTGVALDALAVAAPYAGSIRGGLINTARNSKFMTQGLNFNKGIKGNVNMLKGNYKDLQGLNYINRLDNANPGVFQNALRNSGGKYSFTSPNTNRTYHFTGNNFTKSPINAPFGSNQVVPYGVVPKSTTPWTLNQKINAGLIPGYIGYGASQSFLPQNSITFPSSTQIQGNLTTPINVIGNKTSVTHPTQIKLRK